MELCKADRFSSFQIVAVCLQANCEDTEVGILIWHTVISIKHLLLNAKKQLATGFPCAQALPEYMKLLYSLKSSAFCDSCCWCL